MALDILAGGDSGGSISPNQISISPVTHFLFQSGCSTVVCLFFMRETYGPVFGVDPPPSVVATNITWGRSSGEQSRAPVE